MSNHTVTILQKNYNISCSEDEIPRLEACTKAVNELLDKTFKSVKANSETTIMAIALLTIMDELMDFRNQDQSKGEITHNISTDMYQKLELLQKKLIEIA